MKRVVTALFGALVTSVLMVPLSPAAHAATGEVIIYLDELRPVVVHQNPRGCYPIPEGAHVLVNRTDKKVEVFGVPQCGGPFTPPPIWVVEEDYGGHVPPAAGSFKV